jgi:hypothetical protein
VIQRAVASSKTRGAVHLLVELEVEGVQPLADVAEADLLQPTIEEAILAPNEFVLDEAREEVYGRELLGLGFEEPRLQAHGHAGAAELAQGALQFNDVHGVTS